MKKQALIIIVLIVAGLLFLWGCQPESGSVSTSSPSPSPSQSSSPSPSPSPSQSSSPSPVALSMGSPSPGVGEQEIRRYSAGFSTCQTNLGAIAIALAMYKANNGTLPSKLSDLTPLYLKNLPSCPDAGFDTYSDSYSISQKTGDYTIYCKGHNHKMLGVPSDYPRYIGQKGLILPEGYHKVASPQETLKTCTSNLKNIATALEMYSTDNRGLYPKDIKQICPSYLKQMPTCPAAGADSYSSSYRCSEKPDNFTVYCRGHHHGDVGIPENYPSYDAYQGLNTKPW